MLAAARRWGLGNTARRVTLPVSLSTETSENSRRPSDAYSLPSEHQPYRHRLAGDALQLAFGEIALEAKQFGARLGEVHRSDRVAAPWPAHPAWLAVTSAPAVTLERPIRPAIGEVTAVKPTSMRASRPLRVPKPRRPRPV